MAIAAPPESADRMMQRYDQQKAEYKRWLRARMAPREVKPGVVALPNHFEVV